MHDAYSVSPLRTPIGKFGGALASLSASDLAVKVIQAVLEKTQLDAHTLDEVIIAQSYASSEAPCIGRYAALAAGLPIEVPGYSLDRRCGSGLQALINAAMTIQSGNAEAIMVVGVESMSNIEYYSTNMRWGNRAGNVTFFDRLARGRERSQPVERFGVISGMPETADNLYNQKMIHGLTGKHRVKPIMGLFIKKTLIKTPACPLLGLLSGLIPLSIYTF